MDTLKRHQKIHLNAALPCPQCAKMFSSRKKLSNHQRRHIFVEHCMRCGKPLNQVSINRHRCRESRKSWKRIPQFLVQRILHQVGVVRGDNQKVTVSCVVAIMRDIAGEGIFWTNAGRPRRRNAGPPPNWKEHWKAGKTFCVDNGIPTYERDEARSDYEGALQNDDDREILAVHEMREHGGDGDGAIIARLPDGRQIRDTFSRALIIHTPGPDTEKTRKKVISYNRHCDVSQQMRTGKFINDSRPVSIRRPCKRKLNENVVCIGRFDDRDDSVPRPLRARANQGNEQPTDIEESESSSNELENEEEKEEQVDA